MDLTDPALRFVRAQEQLSCELNGEIAILGLNSKLYFGLQDVGATIWRSLETPQPFESIILAVMKDYKVDREKCAADLIEFLGTLRSQGLLDVETAQPPPR